MEWNETSPVIGPGQAEALEKLRALGSMGKSLVSNEEVSTLSGRKGRGEAEEWALAAGVWQERLFSNVLTQKVNVFEMLKMHIYSVNNLPTETIKHVDKKLSIYYGCLWVIWNHSLPL